MGLSLLFRYKLHNSYIHCLQHCKYSNLKWDFWNFWIFLQLSPFGIKTSAKFAVLLTLSVYLRKMAQNGIFWPGTNFEPPSVYQSRPDSFETNFNLHKASLTNVAVNSSLSEFWIVNIKFTKNEKKLGKQQFYGAMA